MISSLNIAVLLNRKHLLKKAFEKASQVVNELGSSFRSQSLALSSNENGKSLNLIASVDTHRACSCHTLLESCEGEY